MCQIPASVEHVPELVELGAGLTTALGAAADEANAAGRTMGLDAAAVSARAEIDAARASRSTTPERPGGLSRREVDVLRLVADGLTTREIAERLFISAKTADRHIQNIYSKIGTSSRATAARWAVGGYERLAKRLPDKCTIRLKAGDVLRMLTPGGGGWGVP